MIVLCLRRSWYKHRLWQRHVQEPRERAVSLLQRLWRGFLGRRQARDRTAAVARLQKAARRYLLQRHSQRDSLAACRLQACIRGWMQRKRLQRCKASAVTLQRHMRSCWGRQWLHLRHAAVSKLQAVVRGWQYRQRMETVTVPAVLTMQRVVRGWLGRCRAKRRLQAVLRLQGWVRARRSFKEVCCQRLEHHRVEYAQALPCRMPSVPCRQDAPSCMVESFPVVLRNCSFPVSVPHLRNIQRVVRGWLARRRLRRLAGGVTALQRLVRRHHTRRLLFQEWWGPITVIQARCRAHTTTKRLQEVVIPAVTTVQRVFRGFLSRMRIRRQHHSATLLQRQWRAHRQQRRFQHFLRCAIFVQRAWSCALSRRRFQGMRAAAFLLQRRWRGLVARTRVQRLHCSALVVQRLFRGYLVRRQMACVTSSAVRLQGAIRGHLSRQYSAPRSSLLSLRRAVCALVRHRRLACESRAAVTLQRVIRGWMVRRQRTRATVAARLVQRRWRSWWNWHRNPQLVSARRVQGATRAWLQRKRLKVQSQAAERIQTCWRGHIARRRWSLHQRRNSALGLIQAVLRGRWTRKQVLLQRQCVVCIQAVARGFLARLQKRRWTQAAGAVQRVFRGHMARQRGLQAQVMAVHSQRVIRGMLARHVVAHQCAAAGRIARFWRSAVQGRHFFRVVRASNCIRRAVLRYMFRKRGFHEEAEDCCRRIVLSRVVPSALWTTEMNRVAPRTLDSREIRNKSVSWAPLPRHAFRYPAGDTWDLFSKVAQRLQRIWRGVVVRRKLQLQQKAAVCIQCAARRLLARRTLSQYRMQDVAARKIQAAFRVFRVSLQEKGVRWASLLFCFSLSWGIQVV